MSSARWLVRAVYADADERNVVGVLRADPAAWDSDELLAGGRVLGEVFRVGPDLYRWESGTLRMSGSTLEPDMTQAMQGMIDSFDVQNKLDLDALDPLPADGMWDPDGFTPA